MITIIAITIIISYLILIGTLTYGFDKVEDFKLKDLPSKTKFSIVIPFRNEAENLSQLLHSILELNYPRSLFEVILVDDDSEDNSVEVIKNFIKKKTFPNNHVNIKVIQNKRTSNSPKKDAITAAIKTAQYEWILTTDTDCVLPKYWLDSFDEFIQTNNPNCIVAPVTYLNRNSYFNRFQTLDFLSLQGATIGGFGINKPFMGNGANLAYKKSVFNTVEGFKGNTNISSGDDIFILEKMVTYDAKKVNYLKCENAIVKTLPVKTIADLIHQRLRWASKTSKYNNTFAKAVGLIVLLSNYTCLIFIPADFMDYMALKTAMALFVIKFSIDFLLLFKTIRFFKQEHLLFSYLFSSIVYPFFNVAIAILSFFKSYRWKGRISKK
ncbi:glycosyltransferase [Winogradskyella sp. SYSU M77433]|uniref:glycosyltransferase n=1 Tax=Winogradskyella sp. SYSU M77433 TaxID=3042722 RepID=UPI0024803997|nr:glycosyltransferase [Winogradskyella sp. SYSU M77433]MDH7912061.1 glycosyltransferase [Winogradskyella sp. SYSU M77433]